MESLFESLGLNGLNPGLQWLILLWGVACAVAIPVELFFWLALRRTVRHVDLGRVAAPKRPVKPAFLGEDAAKKEEHLALGDAYAGPDLGGAPAAAVAVKRSWLGILRRCLFWALICGIAAATAWLIFGDPFAGTDMQEAMQGQLANKSGMDVLASLWFLIVVTAGRGAAYFVEQRLKT